MKNKFYHYLISLALIYSYHAAAQQVSTYHFLQSNGTYTSIAGLTGTVSLIAGDDNNHYNIPIGFSFTYDGTVFTSLSAIDDGNIVLGTAANNTYISPLSVPNCISVFGYDLVNQNTGAAEYYQTTDTAPNRVFTYEWKNMTIYPSNASTLNMQVKLNEGTNCIQFVYGPCTAGTSNYLVEVGLSGASPATDFNTRASATSWSTTTAGSYLGTISFTPGIIPANGLTYSWCSFSIGIAENTLDQSLTITPNPACDYVTLSYDLATSCQVHAVIYNLCGQAVKELVNQRQSEGKQRHTFGIKNLPEGIYFVKLTAGENNKVFKILKQD